MRRNAPFTAVMALAALSLATPLLEARTTPIHHRTVAQSSAPTPAPKKPSGKAAAKPKHHAPRKKHDASDDNVPPTVTRIHSRPDSRNPSTRKQPEAPVVHTTNAPTLPRPATSQDFVQAAGGAPITLSHSEPATDAPALDASPSQPASVISVIRPVRDRPSLPSIEDDAATPFYCPRSTIAAATWSFPSR